MSHPVPSRRHLILAAGAVTLTGVAACTDGAKSDGTSMPGTNGPAAGSAAAGSPSATGTAPPPGHASTSPRGAATGSGSAEPPGVSASPAPGDDLTHGASGRPEVALTFHGAGDVTILRRMLADFAEAKAQVTVLAIGTWLAADPAAAKLILDGGHELGNHTWSHQTMTRLAPATIRTEVDRAAAELRTLTGSAGRWFRPSGTPHSTAAIRAAAVAAGYGACLSYDVDPLDYTDPGPDAVVRAFRAAVRAGSVVSLHLGHPGTLAAMPRLLATLHERGLTAVTATELMRTS